MVHHGYLYTSTVKSVLRNKLTPGELIPASRVEVILTDEDENLSRHWHTQKPMTFDNDGNMYIPFGGLFSPIWL